MYDCSEDDEFCPNCHFRLKVKDFNDLEPEKFVENPETNQFATMRKLYIEKNVPTNASIDQQTEIGELHKKGTALLNEGRFSEAQDYFLKALDLAKQMMSQRLIAESSFNIGEVNIRQEKLDEGLQYYTKALTILDQLGDRRFIAKVVLAIGNVYLTQNNHIDALSMFQRGLLELGSDGDSTTLLNVYYTIATIQLEQKKFLEALGSFETALTIATQLHNSDLMMKTEINIAEIRQNLSVSQKAIIKERELEPEIVLPTFENPTQTSHNTTENSVEFSKLDTNTAVLRTEAEFYPHVLRLYIFGSLFGLWGLFFLFLLLMPITELPFFIGSFLFWSFLITGPVYALYGYRSYKEQRFQYYSLTLHQIVQQTKTGKFKFFKQNENHYIFKKDVSEVKSFSIVLVFEKNFFLLFAPKKTMNGLSKTFDWSVLK